MKKKAFAIIMCLVLVFSLFPATTFAEENHVIIGGLELTDGDCYINGESGTLEGNGGTASTVNSDSYGVYCNGIGIIEGGTLKGTGGEATTTFAMPGDSTTVTANWTRNGGSGNIKDSYTLSFDTNGGTAVSSVTDKEGSVVSLTQPTSKVGYIFNGWYSDKELTEKVTSVTLEKNMTVYAKWSVTGAAEKFLKDHIAYVVGYADGMVHPEGNITRGETATILFRLMTEASRNSYLKTTNDFSDVNSGIWFNKAVSTIANARFIIGYEDGTFGGNKPITRAEFATIVARADGADGEDIDSNIFTDVYGHWAAGFINEAAEMGLITGYSDGSFKPNAYITRAEAMTLMNRFLGRDKVDSTSLISGMNTWPDSRNTDWYYYAVQEATNSHDFIRQPGDVETWTKIKPTTDWAALEKN